MDFSKILPAGPLAEIYQGDCLQTAGAFDDNSFDLLLTSTPYPGQAGFEWTVEDYLYTWLPIRMFRYLPKLTKNGVIVQNVSFRRTEAGEFDIRVFDIAKMYQKWGLFCVDVAVCDKINAPPAGNHDRHDRNGYELLFIFARGPDYKREPFRKPYAYKTKRKSVPGNLMRQSDLRGKHSGGHNKLHPDGAAQDNVWRISFSGDQGRPRIPEGIFPRELAERAILQYTDPDSTVIDICCGSGTTVAMAARHDRMAVGIEIKPENAAIAQRWALEEQGIDADEYLAGGWEL